MPANLAWTNATGDALFATAGNWQNIDTNMVATANPVAGDNLYFDGDVSNANCFNMGAAMPGNPPISTNSPSPVFTDDSPPPMSPPSPSPFSEYASVHLIDGYAGTVFTSGFRTATLDLESGAISQTAENADLTVSQLFNWTGGVLNSSAITSTINIQGNGTIAPPNAGTLITGSTLNFIAAGGQPKTTTIQSGTVQFNNVASLVVWAGSIVKYDIVLGNPHKIIGFGQLNAKFIQVKDGGTLEVKDIGGWDTNMPIQNTGGFFILNGVITATLSGGRLAAGGSIELADYTNDPTTNGKLHITGGSTLIATHGVWIPNGSVFVIPNPNLPVTQTATIQGKFLFTGGDLVFSPPIFIGNEPCYITFTVTGDVDWRGGRYLPTLDASPAGVTAKRTNKWITTGTLTTQVPAGQTGPSVVPQVVGLPAGQQIPLNTMWKVVEAGTITQGPDPVITPGWDFEHGVQNNIVKSWSIFRKPS